MSNKLQNVQRDSGIILSRVIIIRSSGITQTFNLNNEHEGDFKG
jgi:hypothetical protein